MKTICVLGAYLKTQLLKRFPCDVYVFFVLSTVLYKNRIAGLRCDFFDTIIDIFICIKSAGQR
uniref:Uncharacterized protein n=1 Tax=viral metagenome TaxID=1070528 RepID=A0A6C0CPN2_9ZZZZ